MSELQEIPQANPFANPVAGAAGENMLSTEHTRTAAQVVASIESARRYPRDMHRAYNSIMKACERYGLADVATYSYPRGGETVTGPSIRLIEEIARNWGNMHFGIVQLSQNSKETVMEAYAWDLETNYRPSTVFTVPHQMKARGRIKELSDPRDVYEHTANMGARRLRAMLQRALPSDVIDAAQRKCQETLRAGASANLEDKIRAMLLAFAKLSVTQQHIEDKIGHPVADMDVDEMLELTSIYNSIKDGAAKREDHFKIKVDVNDIPAREKPPEPKTNAEALAAIRNQKK